MPDKWEPKERKSFPLVLEEKAVDLEEGTFGAYFAVTGNFDGEDIIDKGAFKKTLAEGGHRVKLYHIHDWREPIGNPLELKEVPRSKLPKEVLERAPDATGGLYARCKISLTTRGQDDLILLRDGVLNEGSIGYDTIKEAWDELEDGVQVRHIKELKLYDISLVPLAMNAAAVVTDVKEFKPEETEEYIHIPVRAAGDFVEGSFRTITISADQGIKAVIGKLTSDPDGSTKIQKYLFAKDKGWTMEKARAWVKEHKKGEAEWIETAEAQEAEETKQAEELQKALIAGRIQQAQIQRQQIEEL